MISVVIRNKNQEKALSFLLYNLTSRYSDDIAEIIVIDNQSNDGSKTVTQKYNARYVAIQEFSYGGSANVAAREAKHPIIVIFSAHSYPVSHDFFALIKDKFSANENLAGLRCLHSSNDYRNFIHQIPAKEDPNRSGLIFSGSAFSKKIWERYPFREDVTTFEDKEWSKRVLEAGHDIEFVPAIFSYEIHRTRKQRYVRFKNDMAGNYQLWHEEVSILSAGKGLIVTGWRLKVGLIVDLWYALKRFLFTVKFSFNKLKKF